MNEDQPLEIPAPPRQVPATLIKLLGYKFRGDSIYIVFGGIMIALLLFLMLKDSIFLAALSSPFPVILSILFVAKFIEGKPRLYFSYWLELKLGGEVLKRSQRRKRK